ncbi:MAG TPA: hypothetical protein PKI66_03855 [Methanobacteriaceae archaeon]|nr:hypothetical protein [Methanobacteriaceae archaeon]HNS25298.1 hypothetical protein [Methanobacteriaceae archaeon]
MDKIKLPEPNPEILERISDLRTEIYELKAKATRDGPNKIGGYKDGLNILKREAEHLREKAGLMPELFDKDYKAKLKEIEKVEKLLVAAEKETQEIRDKYHELNGSTLQNLEGEVYIPYVIELNRLFWDLQARAFQENNPEYDKKLFEIAQLLDNPPALKYMRVARRTKRNPGRVLVPNAIK